MKKTVAFVSLAALLGCATMASLGEKKATDAQPAIGAAENWENTGGGVDEAGYSRLETINKSNVGSLGLAWSMDLDDEVTLEGTPLAVDGALYFTGGTGSVYATDGVTGKLLWKYDPQVWKYNPDKMHCTFGANRGAAYAGGRIFVGQVDGRLIALDAKTGAVAWAVDTVARDDCHTIVGAPRVFKDKVIIGNSGADFNMRGYVTAYDQATGKQAWRFYTAPGKPEDNKGDPAMEKAAETWRGEYWKTGTGGTVWNGIAFDPEMNRVYIGAGNGGPYNPRVRSPGGGDNLYLASIVALDADTGKYVWHYQMNPGESWDYKATANIIPATLNISGKPRKVLMQSPTNGFFYVIDRETGKVISAEKTAKVTWAEKIDLATGRPVEAPNIRYETGETIMWPSMIGTHNWQAMSYNPKTGLVYIPLMNLGVRYYTKIKPGEFTFGGMNLEPVKEGPEDGTGTLVAWDPVAQKARWKQPIETIWNGGTLSTASNLVFQGTGDGYFSAYDAESGERLWRFNAGLGIIAAPISYSAGGKQYVSVLVGYGGTTAAMSQVLNVGWKWKAQTRRILTFSLDGKEVLPPSAPRDMKLYPVDDPKIKIKEKDVQAGRALSIYCLACHGQNLQGAGSPGPDLRESQIAMDKDQLWAVLHDGALLERGMPKFENFTKEQVNQMYAYIRAAAREAKGTRKPSKDKAPSKM